MGGEVCPAALEIGEGPLAAFPDLVEFLTAAKWPDGTARATGTVMLFVEDGKWKAWLHDRDASMSAFVAASSLEGLLRAAEGAVAGETGDWRADRKKGGRGG